MSKILATTEDSFRPDMLVVIERWDDGGKGLTDEPLRIKAVDWPILRMLRFPPVPIGERDFLLRILDADGKETVVLREISEEMLAGTWLAADDTAGQ